MNQESDSCTWPKASTICIKVAERYGAGKSIEAPPTTKGKTHGKLVIEKR